MKDVFKSYIITCTSAKDLEPIVHFKKMQLKLIIQLKVIVKTINYTLNKNKKSDSITSNFHFRL